MVVEAKWLVDQVKDFQNHSFGTYATFSEKLVFPTR